MAHRTLAWWKKTEQNWPGETIGRIAATQRVAGLLRRTIAGATVDVKGILRHFGSTSALSATIASLNLRRLGTLLHATDMNAAIDADAIADCVLSEFDRLPDQRKPQPRNNRSKVWVPLAGIVLTKGDKLSCVSLGTGMKCLPHSKLPLARGNVLHDWHAETLAIRAFNQFLLFLCYHISSPPFPESDWIRRLGPDEHDQDVDPSFTIREDVSIHMYCSEAPCGDASMELTMDAQKDATPWTTTPPRISAIAPAGPENGNDNSTTSALRGRSNFDLLGAVRCKPSRSDAPPTLSKSCTDKLALKQATSLLSSTASLLISPQHAYLHSLVLPSTQYVPAACERAFSRSGRFKTLTDSKTTNWKKGYRWQPFQVQTTNREFAWSRRRVPATKQAVASNLSAVWTPHWEETLVGGVKQGRKQFTPRGTSMICRKNMWETVVRVAALVGLPVLAEGLSKKKYAEVKESDALQERRRVKKDVRDVLDGWVRNTGDDDFKIG